MTAEIIAVGTELLLGDILNTNAQYLASQLAMLGFTVYYQTVVGDNAGRLAAVLETAKQRCDLLVLSGGLGPTDDDLTKQTAAAVFHDTLVPDAEELAKLHAFFDALGRPMTPNNEKQALIPAHGGKFANENGTAPGILLRDGEKQAILLPGPPSELRPMFESKIMPYLRGLQDNVLTSRFLHVIGIGESELEPMVQHFLDGRNPTTALYAKTGEVHIRITAKAADLVTANAMAEATSAELCALLGSAVYSTDGSTLEECVVHLLTKHKRRLSLAESCTGGLLAQRITSVSGASEVFECGIVSYSEAVKQKLLGVRAQTLASFTVYSAQVAAEMARGVMALDGADYGVGITGIAGPSGGLPGCPVGTVFIGVATSGKTYVQKCCWQNRNRDDVRLRASQQALNMVRLLELGYPLPGAQPMG